MNSVVVPRTWRDASPLSTSRPMRPQHRRFEPVAVELRNTEVELRGVAPQVVVLERAPVVEARLMHLPEAVLQCGGLGGRGRDEGVRMDLGQQKMAKGESHPITQLPFHSLDLPVRRARVRALVVAVLQDHVPRRPADMVHRLIDRGNRGGALLGH
jgi:hypothetical protein